jgi:hypothetical protein
MGVASFVADAIVRIDRSDYRLLRKMSDTLQERGVESAEGAR